MNGMDFTLHFLRPWWWLALAPLPLALWALARGGGGRAALAHLADAALLPFLVRGKAARQWPVWLLVATAWVLGTAALAGPAWQHVEAPLYVNGAARVVVLSLSRDMLAEDLAPNRLTRARFAVRDLLGAAGDARTALVAYAGAAFTVAPLTSDKRTVLNLLQALRPNVMPVPGNAAATGIARGAKLLRDAHVRGGEMVLVTDRAGAAAVTAARAARAAGIRVDVLGIGTTKGAPVPKAGGGFDNRAGATLLARRDDASLRAVADAGGGSYRVLPVAGGVTPTFAAPVADGGRASHDERASIWRDGGIWLLPVLVVLAALAFRRGWLCVLVLLVLPLAVPAPAQAAPASAWWSNRNQRALQALQDGHPRQARKLAQTSGMRGAADYRAGDYAGAAKAFAHGDSATARYNLGNALAKAGKYQAAIGAYQDALRDDPKFADAQANLAAVKAWLKRKPPASQASRSSGSHGHGSKPRAAGAGSNSSAGQSQPGTHAPATSAAPGTPGQGGGKSGAQTAQTQPAPGAGTQAQRPTAGSPGVPSSTADSARAQRGLRQELQQAGRDPSQPRGGAAGSFALGQQAPPPDGKFNARQRAMLRAVPDDPGALLRRKFELEWQQRNGQQQGGGS